MTLGHDFVTRFGHLATGNIYTMDAEQLTRWMHGEDLVIKNPGGNIDSLYIIKDNIGRITGTGKYSLERMRNLLPKRF